MECPSFITCYFSLFSTFEGFTVNKCIIVTFNQYRWFEPAIGMRFRRVDIRKLIDLKIEERKR